MTAGKTFSPWRIEERTKMIIAVGEAVQFACTRLNEAALKKSRHEIAIALKNTRYQCSHIKR